ncbi:uncharacterized protein LOC116181770 [Photinus pyralis]|uniref:uncharacterized protein LOC116181770 n=1 Tax=Photinus pyralis TaxID=7054 RepID=UPI0012670260|nr:uncharacterized protein LOC116181770 [Photinus pyralis]
MCVPKYGIVAMAGETDDNDSAVNKLCKRCNKIPQIYVKCVKCDTVYHPGCAKQLKTVKFINDKQINCCTTGTQIDASEATKCESSPQVNSLQLEISYLKDLLNEKNNVIDNQKIAIHALEGQISLLNKIYRVESLGHVYDIPATSKSNATSKTNKQPTNPKTETRQSKRNIDAKNGEELHSEKKGDTIAQRSGSPKKAKQSTSNAGTSYAATVSNGTKISNEGEEVTPSQNWSVVRPKRSTRQVIVGNKSNTELTGSIKAVEKRVYAHVYKLDPETTEDMVRNYLRTEFPEVICEKLSSKHPEYYSSFKVTVLEKHLSKIMDPATWPVGTCVNRIFYEKSLTLSKRVTSPRGCGGNRALNLEILHINIQCLTNKLIEFESFICDKSYDIICISEHWFTDCRILENLIIDKWQVTSLFCRTKMVHGGVLIFSKKDRIATALTHINNASIELHCEVCCIQLNCKTVIVTMYRSPAGDFEVFCDNLVRVLEMIQSYHTAIAGDFNVLFGTNCHKAQVVNDIMTSYGFIQTIRSPTRRTNCLDNIFINFSLENYSTDIVESGISDHLGQSIKLKTENKNRPNVYAATTYRPITPQGSEIFFAMMKEWDDAILLNNNVCPHSRFSTFFNAVQHFYMHSYPLRKLSTRRQDNGIKWFNENLAKIRSNLQMINSLYSKYGSDKLLQMKRTLTSQYKKQLQAAKIKANDTYIKNSQNKFKAAWDIIKSFRQQKVNADTQLTATLFNSHFISAGSKATNPTTSVDQICNRVDSSATSEFDFNNVSQVVVRDVLHKLRNSNARDIFGFNTKLIKRNISLFVKPLTTIANMIINTNTFPDLMKIALVLPIFKKGDTESMDNYRPISILPVLSKVFEKILCDQIIKYLETNYLLHAHQYGFRKGKSTSDAIINLTTKILNSYEKSQYAIVSFVDFSKAFDCVVHNIIIRKLRLIYKFSDASAKLISSYLTNRLQCVRFNNETSEQLQITSGVPQGSILGPLLFLLYINDLPTILPSTVSCILYADDVTLISADSSYHVAYDNVVHGLLAIKNWCAVNKLGLNANKTITLPFSLKRDANVTVKFTKFLGCMLDSHLNFHEHCDFVRAKCNKSIYVLRRLSQTVSQQVTVSAYYALVHSIISYSILAWGHSASACTIFKLQRRAVRVVAGLGYRQDCRQVFIKLQILTLPSVYILQALCYARDSVDSLKWNGQQHTHNTRNKDNLTIQYCRLTTSQNGCEYQAKTLYNSLPVNVRCLPAKLFKDCIKKYLLSKAFYTFEEFCSSVKALSL